MFITFHDIFLRPSFFFKRTMYLLGQIWLLEWIDKSSKILVQFYPRIFKDVNYHFERRMDCLLVWSVPWCILPLHFSTYLIFIYLLNLQKNYLQIFIHDVFCQNLFLVCMDNLCVSGNGLSCIFWPWVCDTTVVCRVSQQVHGAGRSLPLRQETYLHHRWVLPRNVPLS